MKKLERCEMKNLKGGVAAPDSTCMGTMHCSTSLTVHANCTSSSCSATDDVGVQCGQVYYSKTDICILANS